MALEHKEQAARHAPGQLQRSPLSTAGLGSSQQLRERWTALDRSYSDGLSSAVGCISGPLGHAFSGRDQRLSQGVLCRKEQQSRIHMLAHAHGRPNGSSDIQRKQSFLSRIALKPTTRVLCSPRYPYSHYLDALAAASREPSVLQHAVSGGRLLRVRSTKAVFYITTSERPSKASASPHKGVTRCSVWGRPPGYTKIRWVNRLGTGRSMAAAGQSTR
jgi:hypothetical protein